MEFILFRNIFIKLNSEDFDYTGYYTIVIVCHENNPEENGIYNILSDCWSIYLANVLVVNKADDEKGVLVHTFYPYTPRHCEQVIPVIHNQLVNNTFISNVTSFPRKFQNFYKCPLSVSTYNLEPFMMLTPLLNDSYHTDGLDGIIFNMLSDRMNFTPIVKLSKRNILKELNVSKEAYESKELRPSLDMVNMFTTAISPGNS